MKELQELIEIICSVFCGDTPQDRNFETLVAKMKSCSANMKHLKELLHDCRAEPMTCSDRYRRFKKMVNSCGILTSRLVRIGTYGCMREPSVHHQELMDRLRNEASEYFKELLESLKVSIVDVESLIMSDKFASFQSASKCLSFLSKFDDCVNENYFKPLLGEEKGELEWDFVCRQCYLTYNMRGLASELALIVTSLGNNVNEDLSWSDESRFWRVLKAVLYGKCFCLVIFVGDRCVHSFWICV